jgi:hypothetical protein
MFLFDVAYTAAASNKDTLAKKKINILSKILNN